MDNIQFILLGKYVQRVPKHKHFFKINAPFLDTLH